MVITDVMSAAFRRKITVAISNVKGLREAVLDIRKAYFDGEYHKEHFAKDDNER